MELGQSVGFSVCNALVWFCLLFAVVCVCFFNNFQAEVTTESCSRVVAIVG